MSATAGLVDAAVEISRDPARDAARRELSKPEYHRDDPSLLQRVGDWVMDRIDDLTDGADRVTPSGWFGVLVIVGLLALIVVVLLVRVGGVRRRGAVPPALLSGAPRTAREHRDAAEAAAARGELDVAIRERLRAVARELESRGILDPRPGRTADELVADAGRALPAVSEELRAAARVFDDVWYGGRTATADGYASVVRADDAVRGARTGPVVAP